MLTSSKISLHSETYLSSTVLQATPIICLTGSTICCGAQFQSVSMRLPKETGQNILTASHLSTSFHRSYPSSGNSVQPLSLSYLSGHLALGGLYCLKESTVSFCTRLLRATMLNKSADSRPQHSLSPVCIHHVLDLSGRLVLLL